MRVLVTGANGFIGKHVCKALTDAGHRVIPLDIAIPWIQADITQPLPKMPDLDAVIHLAALSHPRQCDENPAKAFDINVQGTHNVLKMALASGAKKVVFSSSAHVFDIPPRYLPTDELHPLRLNNTYTTTKLLGEQLCHLFYENHGLSYITLRLFNAYGPNQAVGYYIPDQIAKAEKGGFELRGRNVTKDWVFVTDVADAFVKALSSDFVGPINIGTGVETDLGTIAEIIAEAYQVELATFPATIPTRMCADRKRAERVLGWSPTVSLEDGIRNIIEIAMRTKPKMPQSEVTVHA